MLHNTARERIQVVLDSVLLFRDGLNDELDQACSMITRATNVVTCGVGKSGFVARKLAATLTSISRPAVFMHPTDALHGDIGVVRDSDVVIVVSKSGETRELIQLCNHIKSRNATIVSVTGNSNSTVATLSTVHIIAPCVSEIDSNNVVPSTSVLVAMLAGDILTMGVQSLMGSDPANFLRNHPAGAIGALSSSVGSSMSSGADIPVVGEGTPLIDAIVQMTAKSLGCVVVVSRELKLVGIITDGDIRRTVENLCDVTTLSVEHVMTKSPIAISPVASLLDALNCMEQPNRQISVLPVVAPNSTLVGVIRLHDIMLRQFSYG